MEQELSVFEDQEKVERAKKRGKAWQCLHCHNNSQKRWVDIKCRVEDHIMKYHLALEEVPFYCRLCWFRCQRQDQLVGHVTKYKRHVELATQGQVTDHSSYLIKNAQPHVMGPLDYSPLTAEESLRHFLGIRQDSQDSVQQRQKEAAVTQMTDNLQTECLATVQAEPVESSMVYPPLGTVSQCAGLDLSANLLNEGQAASTQLTQMLSNILSNQQFLLATYQATLAAGLSSQPIQGAAAATATFQDVTDHTSSKVKEVEDPDKVSKLNPDDDQTAVSDASFTGSERKEPEESQVINSEPVIKTNQQSESPPVAQENQVTEVLSTSSTSTRTDVLNEQICPAEQEITADSQTEDIQRVQTPDLLQPLDLSMTEICVDDVLPRQVSGERGKNSTVENTLVEYDQPLDLRIVKAAETPMESRHSEAADGGFDLKEGPEEEVQSTHDFNKDRAPEIDTDEQPIADTRNVVLASGEDVPQYVPTPISKLQQMNLKSDAGTLDKEGRVMIEREENVLGEILQEEDMTLSSPVKRRGNPDVCMTGKKKRRTDDVPPELPVDVADLSEKTLVTVVDTFRKAMQQNVAELKEMRKTMVESTVMMSKMVDGLSRYKKTLEDHDKAEQRREERRLELEQRREEERKRDVKRWKDDERRHEEWKREMDRRERQIDRRERELEQKEKEGRRGDERSDDNYKSKSKENEDTSKTVLGESRKNGGFKGRRW